MKYIVDIQALKQPVNEFVVKELAIYRIGDIEKPKVFYFKSPFDWNLLPAKYKAENNWLYRNYHHISWNHGDYSYDCIDVILHFNLVEAEAVFVKGREKLEWLQRYIDNVYNIEDVQNSVSLKVMREWKLQNDVCHLHQGLKTNCAAQNVLLLERFLVVNTPSADRSYEIFYELKNLQLMSAEDIKHLPKHFLINYAAESIDAAWDKIPETLKSDNDMLMCLKCRLHDHSEKRVLPMVKNCKFCIANCVKIN